MADEYVTVLCPSCGRVMKLKPLPDLNLRRLTCRGCGRQALVGDCPRPASDAAPRNGAPTTDVAISSPSTANIGVLAIPGYFAYRLNVGVNIVGRGSPSSTATVRLPASLHAVSREHLEIRVTRSEKSGRYIHYLRLYPRPGKPALNMTSLNNLQLAESDVIILRDKDRIQLPGVELTFYIPE